LYGEDEATFPDTGREFELVEKEIGQATGEMNQKDFRLWYKEWSKRPHIQQLWESESGVGSPYDV
jgi:cysteinyl-tRNA synthetase